MNIINAFEKNSKMKKNNKNTLSERNKIRENKISNKFSRVNQKKKFKRNIRDNSIKILTKSPSVQINGNNKGKNYVNKLTITENKKDNRIPYTESKKILSLKDEEIKMEQDNNLQSIKKNLFKKNFELNDNKIDKKIKSSRFHIGLNKKIISDTSNGGINLHINYNNNNPMMNKLIPNLKMMKGINNRKSKSIISEESLEEIYSINRKFAKRGNSPHQKQKIIIKKKIILDEDLINKEKVLSSKKHNANNKSMGYSFLNLNNIEKNLVNKNYNSLIVSNLNYNQEQKDIDNNKYSKYLYSNSRN
jgi:ribosome-associated toxin RatA of RatAB toxin-antitoxin module